MEDLANEKKDRYEDHIGFRHYHHAIKEPDKQDFQAAMK
jgi:hypothetical protein